MNALHSSLPDVASSFRRCYCMPPADGPCWGPPAPPSASHPLFMGVPLPLTAKEPPAKTDKGSRSIRPTPCPLALLATAETNTTSPPHTHVMHPNAMGTPPQGGRPLPMAFGHTLRKISQNGMDCCACIDSLPPFASHASHLTSSSLGSHSGLLTSDLNAKTSR